MNVRRSILTLLFVLGCGRGLQPEAAVQSAEGTLQMSRARPVEPLLQSRFNIKLRSELLDIAGSTGGGLVTDRPGKGYLAVMGPLGSPLLTVASDGTGLSTQITREKRNLLALDAEVVIREATGGIAGLDDMLAILVGDLPFDEARVKSRKKIDEETARVVFAGPQRTQVVALIDARNGTPKELVARDNKGKDRLKAVYEPFEPMTEDRLMPTRVELTVPALDLQVDLKYKTWKVPDEAPDVFSLETPEGFTEESLEEVVRKMAEELGDETTAGQ